LRKRLRATSAAAAAPNRSSIGGAGTGVPPVELGGGLPEEVELLVEVEVLVELEVEVLPKLDEPPEVETLPLDEVLVEVETLPLDDELVEVDTLPLDEELLELDTLPLDEEDTLPLDDEATLPLDEEEVETLPLEEVDETPPLLPLVDDCAKAAPADATVRAAAVMRWSFIEIPLFVGRNPGARQE
jgi:hypothetical protein